MSDIPLGFASKERATEDFPVQQKKAVQTRDDLGKDEIVAAPSLDMDYQALLAFNEEPVTIIVQRSGEKNAATVVDVWCNGKGAELLHGNRWIETSAIPRGVAVTTKRKYVEILVRSRIDTVQTRHDEVGAERVNNFIDRNSSSFAPVQIVKDPNPRGMQWFENLCRTNY